ncbi:MAG: DUF885 family protein, partial [Parvularculaceae bacterium]
MTVRFNSEGAMRVLIVVSALAALSVEGCGKKSGEEPSGKTTAAETAAQVDPSAAFLELASRHASAALHEAPEMATSLGVAEDIAGEDYNARLGDYGFESNQRARAMNEQFLQELKQVDRSALSGTAAITYDVLKTSYEFGARRNQFEFGGATAWGYASPYIVTQLSGPHIFLLRLLQTQHPIDSKENIEAYLTRLSEFGRVFDEVSEMIGADAALGVVPPYFAIDGAINTIAGVTAPAPADNPL